MVEGQLLLERILDRRDNPRDLPLKLLNDITDNFSEASKIGEGGFGVVYKGVLGERAVAVKKIRINIQTFDDKLFRREVTSLMQINHQNVVRFLGVCSQGYQKPIDEDGSGKYIWAEVLERLLCFEYISNGSLDKRITDELRGLEWETRYEIITGICNGLQHLHDEKNIIHMDLKPANILLEHHDEKYIVAKITDFGLSRPNGHSHTMGKVHGTRGYMAPEYVKGSKITTACDIYSLGLIIIELVTGCKDTPDRNKVLRRWRHRWRKRPTQLRYQQVTRCMEIASHCREENPEDRPSIWKIINYLRESESTNGPINPSLDEDDMLRINPLELLVPSELKNETSHQVELTNNTLNCIAFTIQTPSAQPVKGIVQSGSRFFVTITVQARDVREQDHAGKFIVKSMKWTEGMGQEDIIECMSAAEAHKVVDEVDLMVVYATTMPQENSKNTGDTNMTDEEVPKAKKRKITESSSGKGKNKVGSSEHEEEYSMDINSSLRGKCTAQTQQCNLHTLQSFSQHYEPNKKHLGHMSRSVDIARGAMGSLLDKLAKLVMEDYNLGTSIETDIEYFSVELTKIHEALPVLQNVIEAKVFVDEVRDLSYHIEDMVDRFLVHVEPNGSRIGFKELKHEGLNLLLNGIPTHHEIGYVVKDIKDKVEVVVNKGKKYNRYVKIVVPNATDRATFDRPIHIKKNHLIGIEAPRDKIISLFEEDGNVPKQKLRIVSIVGMGGLGKTTLARVVYDQPKPYDLKAFVPVGQNTDVNTVLKKIIIDCKNQGQSKEYITLSKLSKYLEQLDKLHLDKELQELLKDKRYFIALDDIWDSSLWADIYEAFPDDNCGSRVITTTRNHDAALACCNYEKKYVYTLKPLCEEDSKNLFLRKFDPKKDCAITPRKEEIATDILRKCGGMPLAINSIAALLAGKPDSIWENFWKSLGALTEEKSELNYMKQILDLSYMYLRDDRKTCVLYVCKYPEDREIDKNDLLRQWVAEGFVSGERGLHAEDVAENNFNWLINMCLIEPAKIDYNNEVLSCRVHDIILDFLRSKSKEHNFIEVTDGSKHVSGACGKIHRVSLHYGKENMRIEETINQVSLSNVRSVLLYRGSLVPYFLKFRYIRVLHLKDKEFSKGLDLTSIRRLFLLRYLKTECSRWPPGNLRLPDQIGELQQLETLDLQGGVLKRIPSDIVTLPCLLHLRYDGDVPLPDGIGRLKSLQTLHVNLDESSVDNIKGLGELTNLRELYISSRWTGQPEEITMRLNALHSSILRLSTSLRILTWIAGGVPCATDIHGRSKTLFNQGSGIRKLQLTEYIFLSCPEWIGKLRDLYSLSIMVREVADGMSIVGGLPSLVHFDLRVGNLGERGMRGNLVIAGGGAFQALKHLVLDCTKSSLTFQEGALPKLEKLDILFPYPEMLVPVDIKHLTAPTLREITINVDFIGVPASHIEIREHTQKLKAMFESTFEEHNIGLNVVIHCKYDPGKHGIANYNKDDGIEDYEEHDDNEADDSDCDEEEEEEEEEEEGVYDKENTSEDDEAFNDEEDH